MAHQRRSHDAPFITAPREVREHYSKSFGIESSYRLAKQCLALTSSQDAGLRLVLFTASLLLRNVWRYLHWRYAAGRRLWDWPFMEFCEMVLRAVWIALGVRRSVPANQLLDDRFFRKVSSREGTPHEWQHCRVGATHRRQRRSRADHRLYQSFETV